MMSVGGWFAQLGTFVVVVVACLLALIVSVANTKVLKIRKVIS